MVNAYYRWPQLLFRPAQIGVHWRFSDAMFSASIVSLSFAMHSHTAYIAKRTVGNRIFDGVLNVCIVNPSYGPTAHTVLLYVTRSTSFHTNVIFSGDFVI